MHYLRTNDAGVNKEERPETMRSGLILETREQKEGCLWFGE